MAFDRGADNLLEFFRPPFFMTGDPRREWHFTFLLVAPHYQAGELSPALSTTFNVVFGTLALLYISGLAEKVTIPGSKFTLAPTPFSTLSVPFPKGFEMPAIQVQYLEDDLGLVSLFHRIWQSSIKGYFKGISTEEQVGSDGVVFEELGKLCATAIYSPARMTAYGGVRLEIPLPTGLEVWPAVFPVDISSDAANRSGNNLSKVTVTYARIPVWSMRGNIYEWKPPPESGKGVVVSGQWGSRDSSVSLSGPVSEDAVG
jgi:hypothetical protein